VPGDTQRVAPGLNCLCCVLGYGDGADNFAAVGMDRIDKPGLAQGIVDNGNLLLDCCLNIFQCVVNEY